VDAPDADLDVDGVRDELEDNIVRSATDRRQRQRRHRAPTDD